MKKLKLSKFDLTDILSRDELKKIVGGDFGSGSDSRSSSLRKRLVKIRSKVILVLGVPLPGIIVDIVNHLWLNLYIVQIFLNNPLIPADLEERSAGFKSRYL